MFLKLPRPPESPPPNPVPSDPLKPEEPPKPPNPPKEPDEFSSPFSRLRFLFYTGLFLIILLISQA